MKEEDTPSHAHPVLTAIVLIVVGLLFRRWQPRVLEVPEATPRSDDEGRLAAAARLGRNGVTKVMPGNLTGSIGRSLMVTGVGLILVRALDALVEEDETVF